MKSRKMSHTRGAPKQWVSVEGIIGAGKSTLVDQLNHLNGVEAVHVEEPVKEWIASGILKNAYEEPQVWNFPAQCHFFTSRIETFCNAYRPDKTLYISERSVFTDSIFWNTQLALGRVDERLGPIYTKMWSTFQRLQPMPNPTLFVYLRPTLDECMARMINRNRSEEASVDLVYQSELYRQHDRVFKETGVEMPDGTVVPCLIVDGGGNFRDDLRVSQGIRRTIEEALKGLE